jgi:hypothetical protein
MYFCFKNLSDFSHFLWGVFPHEMLMEIGMDVFDLVAFRVRPVIVSMCQQWGLGKITYPFSTGFCQFLQEPPSVAPEGPNIASYCLAR